MQITAKYQRFRIKSSNILLICLKSIMSNGILPMVKRASPKSHGRSSRSNNNLPRDINRVVSRIMREDRNLLRRLSKR